MALDFPTSPTNGQVYGNFVYSSAKGAWQAKPITGKVTTSATAPSAPSNGDEWFNTNDGNIYVYYTDVDGSQWVQVKSDATLSSTLGNRVTTLETYPAGLIPVVPTSVTVGAGSASVAADGTISFTNVTTLSLNSSFTSTFKNYRVTGNIDSTSGTGGDFGLRLRNAGTDATTNNYYTAGTWQNSQNQSNSYYNVGTSLGYFGNLFSTADAYTTFSMDIANPQRTKLTTIRTSFNGLSTAGYAALYTTSILSNLNDSYDGMTIWGVSGTTMTGTLKVYGYR